MGERIAAIQEVCGLKRPQKASHILRATFVSTAHAKGIDRERYKDYIGHASTKESGRTQMLAHGTSPGYVVGTRLAA